MESSVTSRIKVVQGDITQVGADAIVNAANKSLLGGGGVDGAIHRAAGPELLEYCKTLNGCATGEAKVSPGFKLKAKWVIHTVGPIFRHEDGKDAELLEACYRNAMRLAREQGVEVLAFPNISTGAYGYPLKPAARIALKTVQSELENHSLPRQVVFVCFDRRNYDIYTAPGKP